MDLTESLADSLIDGMCLRLDKQMKGKKLINDTILCLIHLVLKKGRKSFEVSAHPNLFVPLKLVFTCSCVLLYQVILLFRYSQNSVADISGLLKECNRRIYDCDCSCIWIKKMKLSKHWNTVVHISLYCIWKYA